ncbi:hypothetical protein H4219_005144 [Mycoemilia scoparia]|uniref:Uncharacterized protein n=1 Tax=Mycoemilia scoparia TaxID=417184 RepID=A0A9W8DKC8_9FUNG|nr:hypothetical protein H4219_005144 [Mycoemilia scoparia]
MDANSAIVPIGTLAATIVSSGNNPKTIYPLLDIIRDLNGIFWGILIRWNPAMKQLLIDAAVEMNTLYSWVATIFRKNWDGSYTHLLTQFCNKLERVIQSRIARVASKINLPNAERQALRGGDRNSGSSSRSSQSQQGHSHGGDSTAMQDSKPLVPADNEALVLVTLSTGLLTYICYSNIYISTSSESLTISMRDFLKDLYNDYAYIVVVVLNHFELPLFEQSHTRTSKMRGKVSASHSHNGGDISELFEASLQISRKPFIYLYDHIYNPTTPAASHDDGSRDGEDSDTSTTTLYYIDEDEDNGHGHASEDTHFEHTHFEHTLPFVMTHLE